MQKHVIVKLESCLYPISERLHDYVYIWPISESAVFFLLFIYICIAVRDQIVKTLIKYKILCDMFCGFNR